MKRMWVQALERKPTASDGPMANRNKVQVEVLTTSGRVERRNFFVATPNGNFDDEDVSPVTAWGPLPRTSVVE